MVAYWQREDLVALLAWVDFCIKFGIDFDDTIEEHMRRNSKNSKIQAEITKKKVKQKIADQARIHWKPQNAPALSPATIMKLGTTCIEVLQVDFREEIRQEINDYERRGFASLKDGSRQRGGSNPENKGDTEDIFSKTREIISTDKRDDNSKENERGTSSQGSPCANSEQKATKVTEHTTTMQTQRGARCETIPKPVARPSVDRQNHRRLKSRYETEMSRKEEEIKKLRTKWQEEAYELVQQQSKSAQTILELRAQIKHRDMAEKQSQEAGKNPMEETLFQYMHQNWSLLQRVQEMKKQLGFCQRAPEQIQDTIKMCMRETMGTIESELESLLHSHDHYASLVVPMVQRESDLGCLIRSVFGLSTGEEMIHFRRCIAKYGSEPELVVRAFVSAALKEWVFLTSFPGFATRSQLLDSYRRIVLVHDGWNCARNLEVAAYQTLLDEPKFKCTTVPTLASQLATRFSEALAPLFPIRLTGNSYGEPRSWGQNPDVVASRDFGLVELFSAALVLKAKTILVENTFGFIVYPPGSQRRLETEDFVPNSPSMACQVEGERQSWQYASIHMYRAKPSIPGDSAADALVNQRNFVARQAQSITADSVYEATVCISSTGPRTPSSDVFGQTAPDLNPKRRKEGDGTESTQFSVASVFIQQNSQVGPIKSSILNNSRAKDTDSYDSSDDQDADRGSVPRLECDRCHGRFQAMRALMIHEKNGVCGRCSHCGNILRNKAKFTQHRNSQHAEIPEVIFDTTREPAAHSYQHTASMRSNCNSVAGNNREPSTCESTDDGDSTSLRESEERKTTGKKFRNSKSAANGALSAPRRECYKCGKRYAYLGSLETHIKEKICGQCLECNKWFETQDHLFAHRLANHGTPRTILNDRISSDNERGSLGSGQLDTTSPMPKSNSQKRVTLSSDAEIESSPEYAGDKMYECTTCTEKFSTPWDRDAHNHMHACDLEGHRAGKDDVVDGMTEVMCKQCGASFIPRASFKRRKLSQNMSPHESPMV